MTNSGPDLYYENSGTHGIREACYSFAPWSEKHEPFMQCSCGFKAHEPTWQNVGAAMDDHLRAVVAADAAARGEK